MSSSLMIEAKTLSELHDLALNSGSCESRNLSKLASKVDLR